MIPRIKAVKTLPDYRLGVQFDDGKIVLYDVKEDIGCIEDFKDLMNIHGLFSQVQLDESRTCLFWNDRIDLPSDTIYEYGEDWDPDFTKLTPEEAQRLKGAEEGKFMDESEVEWEHLEQYAG